MVTKQTLFLLMTLMAVPTFVWLGITYKWAERGLVGIAFLSTAFLIDINFYSMEIYRGDSRGYEIGLTDWIMLSLLIVMLTSKRWKNKKITLLPPNSGLLAVYLAIAIISVYVAYVQIYAGFGLLKILRGLMVFVVAYNYLQDEEDLRFIIGVLALIVIIEFVMVIDQRLSGMYRAKGSTPHSNTLAGYINMINMLFFALLLGDKSRPTLYWIVLGLGSLIVLASFSRGAMMAMIVGYLIVIVLSYKNKFDMRKNGILALMLLLAMPIAIDVGPRVIDRFLNASEASGASRKLANVAAAAMADDHFFGVGLNNYSHAINETHYIEHIDSIVDRGIVHNIYLLHASEMGWIGMIAFCLVIGNFLRLGYRSISASSSELASNVAIGLTTAIVVLSMQGSLEWFFRQTYITIEFFMFAGFLVAIPKVSVATNRQRKINQYMKKIALSR
jgi:hypothetical protein